jgi:hypothetical protein
MRPLFFTAFALVLAAGCAAGGSDDAADGGSSGSAGTAGTSPDSDLPRSLVIEPIDEISARAQVEVIVHADPPGIYRVRFSLPSNSGDAALDAAEMDTDAAGRAIVRLTAPSAAATFDVRASVGSVVATQSISVTGPDKATIRVQPVILGHRTAPSWYASVHVNETCANVKGVPPEDADEGEPWGLARAQDATVIMGVPTGVPLAVTLRSGHFMGGCQTLDMLPAEATQTPPVVLVNVLDRQVELAASSLSLSLGLTETGAWDSVLARATTSVLAGLYGATGVGDADALLDAMQASLPTESQQQSFQNARLAENWNAVVGKKWGSATKMTDLVSGWLAAGKAKLGAGDHVLVGFLAATGGTKANYALETVAGIPAGDAGFSKDAQVTWSASPDDTVVMSTFMYFSSSRLLTALAEPAILMAHDGAGSVGAALSTELSCEQVGDALAAAGTDPELGYDGCNGACLGDLCRTALVAIWQRARDSAAPIQLGIAATGQGFVGDEAQLSGMNGTWVGELIDDDDKLATGGGLTGGQPTQSAE